MQFVPAELGELGLPVILAGLFIAIPLLVSPVRIWLGHLSDAYPLRGRRREPYLILGALLSGGGVALSVALVVQTPALASVLGAGMVDLMHLVTNKAPLLAYGAAFAAETALLIGALLAYGRLRIRAARALSAG